MAEWEMQFIDSRTVEHTYFLERRVTPVRKHEGNPVIEPCIAMQTVLRAGDGRLRMWYATRRIITRGDNGQPGHEYQLRCAESEDGLAWTMPALGIKEIDGSRANNVLITGNDVDANGRPLTGWVGPEGFCVLDAEAAPTPKTRGRYTALYLANIKPAGLCMAYSDDGLHWLAYPENPVFPGWPDMFNNFFFDRCIGRYVMYHRPEVHAGPRWVNRLVARSESDDLVHWDSSRVVLDTDGRDAPAVGTVDEGDGYPRGRDVQFYGMTVTPYGGLYLGMAQYYDVVPGRMSTLLLHSFDGIEWRREAAEKPFIAPTPGVWDSESVGYIQAGSPVEIADKLYFYFGGSNVCHHDGLKRIGDKTVRRGLGVGIVPRGRLVGYHAGTQAGELLTRPFDLKSPRLALNVDAQEGEVTAGVTDERGAWIPGFSFDQAEPIRGDGLDVPLEWKGKKDLGGLVGKTVRLRIAVRKAAVYGFAFGGRREE